LVIGADNTTATSALTPFDSNDVGNILHITAGTNFTVGWYEVISVNIAVATLDRACGTATSTGGTARLGGAMAITGNLANEFFAQFVAGNKCYIASGTHTLAEHIDVANDGTYNLPIMVIGYKTTRTTKATGDDRPLIAEANYYFDGDNYWIFQNLRATSNVNYGIAVGMSGIIENCKATVGTYGNRYGISCLDDYSNIVNCEIDAVVNGGGSSGFRLTRGCCAVSCYLHSASSDNSSNGIVALYPGVSVIGCAIYSFHHGINCSSSIYNFLLSNCVISTCNLGIYVGSDCSAFIIVNNIFDANTTGMSKATSASTDMYFAFNCWNNGANDVVNLTKGATDITANPLLTDASTGDFTVGITSPCLGVGFPSTLQGATGTYKWNIGVDQDDNTAAGGGGGGFAFFHND